MKKALSDRAISALPHADPGKRYDISDTVVPGFGVRVTAGGSKTYTLYARFVPGAGPTRRAIGEVGAITLKAAREIARDWRESIRRGVDPGIAVKRAAEERRRAQHTFESATSDYLAARVIGPDPENPILRRASEIQRQIALNLNPAWGSKPLREITSADVQSLIKAKAKTAPAMARNLFATLRTFFKWVVHEHETYGVETSPCASISIGLIVGATKKRARILNDDELRLYWRNAKRLPYPFGPMYRLLGLTALRLNEVAGAHRDEFDFAKGVWIIPAARMKGRNEHAREHLVPITDAIRALVESLPKHNEGGYIFSTTAGILPLVPGDKAKKMLDRRMLRSLKALRRMRGEPTAVMIPNWVNHDLRRTVRTNLSSFRTVSRETREAILAHVRPGIEGVYDLYDHAEEKREALTLWAELLVSVARAPMSEDLNRFVC